MGTAGGLEERGLMVSEPPDMERDRSFGLSYSSIESERMRRGILVTCCMGTPDTESRRHAYRHCMDKNGPRDPEVLWTTYTCDPPRQKETLLAGAYNDTRAKTLRH